MPSPITVLLVDDHELIRQTLRDRLNREENLRVLDTVATADEALKTAFADCPDVVVFDIDMPGLSAFDAARNLCIRCPDTRIVFLSAYCHDHYIDQALAANARAFVTKTEPVEAVIEAIGAAARNRTYFSPDIRGRLVIGENGPALANRPLSRAATLTPRELEVLRYVAQGLSKKEIANQLSLSTKTVDTHCMNLMKKLDIHSRVELTRFAIREGLTKP